MLPARLVHDFGIRAQLRLLIGAALGGLAVFALLAFVTIDEIGAGSPEFAHNRVAGEVGRDFAAPSQSLLSIYPFFSQPVTVSAPADVERLKLLLLQAHAKLEAGHQHYLPTLAPGHLRDLVAVNAYVSAEEWFYLAENEYMPAIERGDLVEANTIRAEEMEPLFQRNSDACEEIGRLSDKWRDANRAGVAATVHSRTWQLAAWGAAVLLVQILLGAVIDARVGASKRQLQATLEELRRKDATVGAFVHIVSHDLRTPLVNLQGFSSELDSSYMDLKKILGGLDMPDDVRASVGRVLESDIKDALYFISAASSRFKRLIDCLLQFSRLDREEYVLAPIHTRSLVQNTLGELQSEIEQAGASVVLDDLPDLAADSSALGLVFNNLLSNAVKYRAPGRKLIVRVGGQTEKGMAHVWVGDNGVGIPARAMPRLFKIFQRLHPDLAPGEGMGLAVVQRIVELHRGKVWAESTADVGTTIHICLPTLKPSAFARTIEEIKHHAR